MTSRTNRHSVGRNRGGAGEVAPADLAYRRQLAVKRYLDGDPIERICQEMGCSKSWLYKWKKRYQHSRRPDSTPTKTPAALAAEIVRLRQTLSSDGSGTVSADVIRDHLRQHRVEPMPSRRTIYRILNRQRQEGPFSSITIDTRTALLAPPHIER